MSIIGDRVRERNKARLSSVFVSELAFHSLTAMGVAVFANTVLMATTGQSLIAMSGSFITTGFFATAFNLFAAYNTDEENLAHHKASTRTKVGFLAMSTGMTATLGTAAALSLKLI